MNTSNNNAYLAHAQRGSSLIGVAILTLVMGFLMTGAIYLMQNYDVIKADQKTVDTSITLEKALKNFIAIKKRYPCPAPMNVAPDAPGFGLEDCSITPVNGRDGIPVLIGTAPVRTLNIPDKMIVDGYGKRHVYAVTQTMTAPSADILHGLGAISIHDDNGVSVSQKDGYVTYALISVGQDDRGAYNLQGKLLEPCGSAKNCNGTATFVSSSLKTFRGETTDFTHSFAFKASAVDYDWASGNWSECGEDATGTEWSGSPHAQPACFSSYQARDIKCRDRQGNEVALADETNTDKCGHTTKPAAERVCSLGPCRWNVRAWSACGGGGGYDYDDDYDDDDDDDDDEVGYDVDGDGEADFRDERDADDYVDDNGGDVDEVDECRGRCDGP